MIKNIFGWLSNFPLRLSITYLDKFEEPINKININKLNNLEKLINLFDNFKLSHLFMFKFNEKTGIYKCFFKNVIVLTIADYGNNYLLNIGTGKYLIPKEDQFTKNMFTYLQNSIIKQIDLLILKDNLIKNYFDGNITEGKVNEFIKSYNEFYNIYDVNSLQSDYEKVSLYFKHLNMRVHEKEFDNIIYLSQCHTADVLNRALYHPSKGLCEIRNPLDFFNGYISFYKKNGLYRSYNGLMNESILEELKII